MFLLTRAAVKFGIMILNGNPVRDVQYLVTSPTHPMVFIKDADGDKIRIYDNRLQPQQKYTSINAKNTVSTSSDLDIWKDTMFDISARGERGMLLKNVSFMQALLFLLRMGEVIRPENTTKVRNFATWLAGKLQQRNVAPNIED